MVIIMGVIGNILIQRDYLLRIRLEHRNLKCFLIETYIVGEVLTNTDMNGEIFYTREISHFDGKQRYLKQVFGDETYRYFSYYIPLVAFHSNWNNLTRQNFDKDINTID